ncbi:transposase [Corynebacterium choanae]|uniref:integrase core domain-containing protein n=1 Tax=Corynebacterium choanae TaxID=1862358 RepID=UPI000F502974
MVFIAPGQLWQNGFVESLHNRMRDELWKDNHIEGIGHARVLHKRWRVRYNPRHPYSSLEYLSPSEFAAQVQAGQETTARQLKSAEPNIQSTSPPVRKNESRSSSISRTHRSYP